MCRMCLSECVYKYNTVWAVPNIRKCAIGLRHIIIYLVYIFAANVSNKYIIYYEMHSLLEKSVGNIQLTSLDAIRMLKFKTM